MSGCPEPSLEPAGHHQQGPEETRNKDPSFPSSSQEDNTKGNPSPGTWQLPPLLVILVYCLSQALWAHVYLPLLGLSVAVADLASYYLSISVVGFYILWWSSLQTAGALTLILAWKFWMEVVVPMHQAVWQPWLDMKSWSLAFLWTLLRWGWGCTWNLLRDLSLQVGTAVLSWTEGAYGSIFSFCQEKGKAVEVIIGSVLQQLLFTLLLSCLKGIWAVFSQCLMVIRDKCSYLLDNARCWWSRCFTMTSLESCISSLSSSGIPLSQRFPGPDPSSFSWRSPDSVSLGSLVVQRDKEEGSQNCPGRGTAQVPLNSRFQGRRRTARSPSGQGLAQRVKTACVLVILLYIYGATLLIHVLK